LHLCGIRNGVVDQAKSAYLRLSQYVRTVTDSNAILNSNAVLKLDPKSKALATRCSMKNDVCGASEETAKN
jgi:hypothetical protein